MVMAKHFLLIDDDIEIGVMLQAYLSRYGYQVSHVVTGRAGKERLKSHRVDLLILDVRLPDEDGFELLREVRRQSDMPVIMLTGLEETADRVVGLELGADDYLTKPFDPRELLARIRAVLRRYRHGPVDDVKVVYRFAGYRLDPERRELELPVGRRCHLTRSELRLLLAFVQHPGRLLSRERLLDLCHPQGNEVFDRSIDVQVLRLRRKLDDRGSLITTKRGGGYRFEPAVEQVSKPVTGVGQCFPGARETPRRSQVR